MLILQLLFGNFFDFTALEFIFDILKGNKENWSFTLESYPCINNNFWWSRFFLVRHGCQEILTSTLQLATLFAKQ